MAGRPRKLTDDAVLMIRAWWRARREMPTRRQMCEFFGVSEGTLMKVAHRRCHKAVRP